MQIRQLNTDVVIVGGSGAGCRAAIEAAENDVDVILVDKGAVGRTGATNCALWSIQSPMGPRGRDARDTPEQMFRDMVPGGRFLGDQNILEVVTENAIQRVLDLERYGVRFKKTEDGRFYQTPMPGQTYPRSCFMIENGNSMATVLGQEVGRHKNVTIKNDFMVFRLLTHNGEVAGVLGLDTKVGELIAIYARATILASGGYASLWGFSDNPSFMTGDAISMAYQAGADIVDLEFNQYYGTDIVWPESVRGVCVLYELLIEEFAHSNVFNSDGEPVFDIPLPIRDEAIKIIYRQIQAGKGGPHGGLFYDLTRSPKTKQEVRDVFMELTPKHYQFVKNATGIDWVETPVEVSPAAHYQCGGVSINERCESTLKRLYACGECSGNFQGANRLAGTALAGTQGLGAHAGKQAALFAKSAGDPTANPGLEQESKEALEQFFTRRSESVLNAGQVKAEVRAIMDEHVSPLRSKEGLETALEKVRAARRRLPQILVPEVRRFNLDLVEAIESQLMLDASELTIGSALFRTESRGHHVRLDYPAQDDKNWRLHTVVRKASGEPVYGTRPVIYTKMPPPEA